MLTIPPPNTTIIALDMVTVNGAAWQYGGTISPMPDSTGTKMMK
jgi:hypothetical protein